MKYLLLILLLILTGCDQPLKVTIVEPVTDAVEPQVYNMPLIKRQGLYYKPHSVEPFTGENRVWYRDGQLEQRGHYKDGRYHGFLEFYEEDGSVTQGYPKCYQNDKEVDLSICKQ